MQQAFLALESPGVISSVSCAQLKPYASSVLTSKAVSQLSLVAFSLEFVTEATQAISTGCSLVWGSLSSVELLRGWVYWSVALALQTIREVQPDVVVVELCQYRVSMLKMDERTLLREAKEVSLEKLQQAVRQVRTRASRELWVPGLHKDLKLLPFSVEPRVSFEPMTGRLLTVIAVVPW